MTHPFNESSGNVLEQINELSRLFRKQISKGDSPRIEQFLSNVADEARENLFSALLEIEVHFRQRKGSNPTSDEYLQRFPQFTKHVRRAFFEPSVDTPSVGDEEGATKTQRDSARDAQLDPTFEIPSLKRLGDYELIGELGRGGMGIVHEARHTKTGNRVALKTLPTSLEGQPIDANRLHRFRKEFRSLSEVNHPNLVGMQTLEVEGDRWFFTMDLIEGEDFIGYVRPGGQLDEARLRACLPQLAKGIMALHDRGIVHRDLKPGNVLVSSEGRVVILDFGLVAQLQQAADVTQTRSAMFVGTAPYAAPEQLGGNKTEANDWYAMGTMLYEALIGQVPFRGSDAFKVLMRKQQEDPPKLSDTEGVSSDLAELADGLIVRDPKSRLNAESVAERLQMGDETRTRGTTQGSKGSHGSVDDEEIDLDAFEQEEIVLIGRERQLAELEAAKKSLLETREPAVVWVTGLSGEGKSSLVEKFLQPIRHGDQMLVLSGRCYDRESVPFKVIDCWMDSLVSFLRSRSESYLTQVLADDLAWLAQIFPVLKRVKRIEMLSLPASALIKPENLRQLAFGALRNLLVRISSKTPVIVFVDDLQWGDADSLAAFKRMFAMPDAPALLFLGSYRTDEADESPFLCGWEQAFEEMSTRSVEVGPLTLEQSLELFSRLVPEADAKSKTEIERAYRESGGNAFFLSQLLDGFDRDSGEFQPIPLSNVLENRLSRLPGEARTILEMLSVYGKSVAVEEIGTLTGLAGAPFDTLTRMRNEKLVRWLGSRDHQLVDTFHDQVRETVMAELPADEQRRWHRSITASLEQTAGTEELRCSQYPLYDQYGLQTESSKIPRVFDLAFHSYEAHISKTLDYQVLAGEESLRAFSNDEAARLFERAASLLGKDTPAEIQFRVWSGLSQAKLRMRETSEAAELSRKARQFATTDMDKILSLYTEAVARGDLGELSQSIQLFDAALEQLGRRRPKSPLAEVCQIVAGLAKAWLIPEFRLGSTKESRERAAKETEIYAASRFVLASSSSFLTFIRSAVTSSIAAFQSEKPELVTLGHSGTYVMFNALGFSRLAKRPFRRFRQRQTTFSSPVLEARADWDVAFSSYFSELGAAEEDLKRAMCSVDRCGEVLSGTVARHFLRHAYAWNDSSARELETAQDELRFAREYRNFNGIFWGLYACADPLARAGRLGEASEKIQQAWTHEFELGSGTAVCHCTEAYVMLQSSQYTRAESSCQQSWEWIRPHWFFWDYMVRCLPLWVDAMLGPRWIEEPAIQNPKLLRTMSWWMWLLYRNLKNLQPSILRSWGRIASSQGNTRRAVKYFQRSVDVSAQYDMPYYRAKSLLDLAAVKEEGRCENRAEAIRLLKKMESVIPRAESWLLGDQYDEAVVAPEFDLEAWEREHGSISAPARSSPSAAGR